MGSDPIPCEAVLFDLDNTLYEYAPCNAAGLLAAEQVLATQYSLGEGRFQELHDIVRLELAEELKGSAASHERSLFFKRIAERSTAPEDRGSHPGLAIHMFEAYWGAFMGCKEPAPHAHEQLSLLAGTHRLALVSNHTNLAQLKKVEALGFGPYFEVIITSEEAGVEKPHARIFELALEALGVQSERAWWGTTSRPTTRAPGPPGWRLFSTPASQPGHKTTQKPPASQASKSSRTV